jgi:hypothetical protein
MPIDLPPPESRPPAGAFDMPVAADSPTSFSSMAAAPGTNAAEISLRRKRPFIMFLAIGSAALISLLAITVLYSSKWSSADEYNSAINVWGYDSWKGGTVMVTVTGDNLPSPGLSGELTEKDNMFLRFHVPPGKYKVQVRKDGTLIDQQETHNPMQAHTFWWPFHAPPAVTQMSAPK